MIDFTSLISSSSGNSTLVTDGSTSVLVDCGMTGKKLFQLLDSISFDIFNLDAILITHEHSDHIKGAGVISRRFDIPVYATQATHSVMEIGNVSEKNRLVVNPGTEFEIGTLGVKPFSIPHDAIDPVGYNFFSGSMKVSIATDLGYMSNELLENLLGSDKILLESNHDVDMLTMGRYPYYLKQRILSTHGHLSNDVAADTAVKLVNSGTHEIMLGHLSRENNMPQVAHMTVANAMKTAGIQLGRDATLLVASPDDATSFYLCSTF